ncbi:MAG: acetyl-CoA carboxylase biotin carboxyl carrier protein subunit [Myxococcales bacterium]|nr:acetyl-CoA carboxylase biotin carboxyl carrier protein subunit [Myxococcales bacterium]
MDIKAHITGTVWKIEAQIGDELDEEDVVMILESMKMEMPIEAPADGVLTEILVEPNQSVQEGQVVARMTED